MRIPRSFIDAFLPLDLSIEALADTLTLLGIEVEGIHPPANDPILELSLTPNLGHCLSGLGLARELAAALQKPLRYAPAAFEDKGVIPIRDKIRVVVQDAALCPRYMSCWIGGVQIGPSPEWLQQALLACGMKPIHNAVDIANYVMIRLGQPLHVFDADRLIGASLTIAPAKQLQSFLGLDGIERKISPGTLLIADQHAPVAIAGILGSLESAVGPTTRNLLIESAYFDPICIREGAKSLGLRTESSLRFEKGVDPNGVPLALNEAAHWILELCGGMVAKGRLDIGQGPFPKKHIPCRLATCNRLLGIPLSQTEVEEIFQRLDCTTQLTLPGTLSVAVPTYRHDLNEEIDLVEEIARIYGYNNIDKKAPLCIPAQTPQDPSYLFEQEMRVRCVALGLQEFITPDLISPKLAALALEVASPDLALLRAIHAKTEEYSILRPSLLPSLLQVAKRNFDQKNHSFSAFEIGRIHFLQGTQPFEIPMAAILLTGKRGPMHWGSQCGECDFYDLKGILEMLFEALLISPISFQSAQHLSFHPGRQADIQSEDVLIGSFF